MIEPQEASNQFADDYDVNEIRDLPFGQVPFQSPALMPATEPPKGNPDPHLVVEQEELPAQLFQVPDAITPLAREGDSVVQLKQNGFNIVLLWSLFEDSVLASGQEPFKLSNCKKSDCFVTRDRSQLADADAIIIHISETVYPEKRAQNQLWVLYIDRPDSTKSYPDLVRSHQFNLTWTYRQDSDIISSAAYFIESTHRIGLEQNLLDNSLFDKWRYKSLMLMITQNKCEPNELIEQLKALTDVAIYGECGKPLCQGHDNHINCYPVVAKKHLFALDLTSESCSPLTQNVVNALDSSLTIPIVLNKTKSSLTCPPDSMIAASDFKSARDLADYLNFVGSDFNQYKKFFNWKRQFELTKEKLDGCQLCEIIGDKSRQHVYTDIGSWLDKDSCLN
ncbi:3-galactosyl-N-acetylglucosaminide 4-alpha-L-fucosyltransferase FUT3 [Halotydeus destructor]|nr:3-galactosyl-N-acetylglucosaminide 4-alpha-L-fucosyltransferase FUT3 [Halotydeus destructor]